MKLPHPENMENPNTLSSVLSNENGGLGGKYGGKSFGGRRGNKSDGISMALNSLNHTDKDENEPIQRSNRYTTMKRVADEQRKKVREQRDRQMEEERIAMANRKQEELRIQIRTVLDNILVDVRKDILLVLQDRITVERENLKDEMKTDLKKAEENLTSELEKRLVNGEPFDRRVARVQKEFEDSFNKILKSELSRVQREVLSDIEQKIDREKLKWEEKFKRETDSRIHSTEKDIRKEFQSGLEDSQKHCNSILKTTNERIQSVEHKLSEKIDGTNANTSNKIESIETDLKRIIENSLNERDKTLQYAFTQDADRIRTDITEIRGQVSQIQSKCCTIL